ncbi:MAG: hypothetical protein OGMRLDGQ_003224 [Candidatus Fervidibacter sp.]
MNAWHQSVKECQAFQQKHGLTFPVLVDEKGFVPDRYGVSYVPYLVVIDHDGKIRFAGRELEKMEHHLKQLVGQNQ